MKANIAVPNEKKPTWGGGGVKPFGASYGKMMMWSVSYTHLTLPTMRTV